MYYVEVFVATQNYHGKSALTYSSTERLERGGIVVVPLRKEQVLGVVIKVVAKPHFTTKPISNVPTLDVLPQHLVTLLEWMPSYYPGPLGVITQHFLPKRLPSTVPSLATDAPERSTVTLPPLTTEQTAALKQIGESGLYLLHGDTGTGKTRVYIELAKRAIAKGSSVVVLTPEISLTSQLASDFQNVFGDQVMIVHSQLTETTRRALWLKALEQTKPMIVVGPRSALFMPIKPLGLTIIDEAHEPAYKQDQAPYYHAARVASKLADITKSPIVLGTATPLVTDYYIAEQKERPIIRMEQIAVKNTTVKDRTIDVVNLHDRTNFTKSQHLSDTLLRAMSKTLSNHEQTILFLNRRGTARIVFCEDCDWQAACPHCDLPLVYHGDTHRMLCHTCGYNTSSPTSCPNCGGTSVIFKSVGTKAITDEVARLFPEANVQRFDADNKKDERIEQHYEEIKSGHIDIVVGTQLLAKGLDLPKLSLVGVVLSDTSLYLPDFTAEERTYQLLSQVIGRVGRGHRDSHAVIQTYEPESSLLKAVLDRDWQSFYDKELSERRRFVFPPFCYLLKLSCRRATSLSAQKTAERFAQQLRTEHSRIAIDGPAPAFHEKVRGQFVWQMHIKARNRALLLDIINKLPSGWSYDIDPLNLI